MGVKERKTPLTEAGSSPPKGYERLALARMTGKVRRFGLGIALVFSLAPATALAHGGGEEKPGLGTLVREWEFDPLFIASALIASWLYFAGLRRVNRLHPGSPWPHKRTAYFFGGVAAMVLAVMSPLAAYDTTLFAVHMWQHMLITMVAAPLVLLGTPITLGLRAASTELRREVLLPILHSRAMRVITFPAIAWLLFAATMWGSHFSPLYDEALDNAWAHRFEHFWYLGAALLFWWQVIQLDPTPWRMSHPVRLLYLGLQMPQNTFLAVAIYGANEVLYDHYATVVRDWGPSPLSDQQLAGITMWVVGDLLFLLAAGIVAYGWVKHEERESKRVDRQLARERAAAGRA
jgi:putative copper resistance protein D